MAFPASKQLIDAAEVQLGRQLLPNHRARLASNNGGEIVCGGDTWQLHPVCDDTDRRRAARTANHIVQETREARDWQGFPRDGIAIANDGSGNLLVLRSTGNRIERWDHETGECSPVEIDWSAPGS